MRTVKELAGVDSTCSALLGSTSSKIGCRPESRRRWAYLVEVAVGGRPSRTTGERSRVKAPGREDRELKQATEALRKATGSFRRWAYGFGIGRAADRGVNCLG